ncbi:MAG: hypothetical protein C5B44_05715 [Acidobacteria bacterium]|nr:MAG: hypothetical protein C5B44_05715 [Acidobacteriota bacterium]
MKANPTFPGTGPSTMATQMTTFVDDQVSTLEAMIERIEANAQEQIKPLRSAIAALRGSAPQPQTDGTNQRTFAVGVKVGAYRGMSLVAAIQAYLNEHNGGPVPVAQLTQDLLKAGVLIGKKKTGPKRPATTRDVRICISNNGRKKFVYDVDADLVRTRASLESEEAIA